MKKATKIIADIGKGIMTDRCASRCYASQQQGDSIKQDDATLA
jgi:hypothetical protein